MEKIEQRHREAASNSIKGGDEKSVSIRARIIAGDADHHPAVQAAAFYDARLGRRAADTATPLSAEEESKALAP